MNLRDRTGRFALLAFRLSLALRRFSPTRRSQAFGTPGNAITSIVVINLDRQPDRWRRMRAELGRLRAWDGRPFLAMVKRLAAIDARDQRRTAPTADVDPLYHIRDQLFVQPDPRLSTCFDDDEPIRMTPQEIAVARSHIEAWKHVAEGLHGSVLILEDDVYFARRGTRLIDRGWREACGEGGSATAPDLMYLSYLDAGGSAGRADVGRHVFRPTRGLWHLSGYVLSREGAAKLLHAMPVVGPVDLWINRRFSEMIVVALAEPAILQRPDGGSDNAYSILPYLSRAGVVDAVSAPESPKVAANGPVFAWNAPGSLDALGMALSMLGFRVRSGQRPLARSEYRTLLDGGEPIFDAYVDAVVPEADLVKLAYARSDLRFIVQAVEGTSLPRNDGSTSSRAASSDLPADRALTLSARSDDAASWHEICRFLGRDVPDSPFPVGVDRSRALFSLNEEPGRDPGRADDATLAIDASPWVLPSAAGWTPRLGQNAEGAYARGGNELLLASLNASCPSLRALSETFPGNLAHFDPECVAYGAEGVDLTIVNRPGVVRRFRSGSLTTVDAYRYGRFEVEMKATKGLGLVTGFFLHRARPRQEIDIEVVGGDPSRLLLNVFFNPGDEGANMEFGYRGTPVRVDLGFDASEAFHHYAIEWSQDGVLWLVDGEVVHRRKSWDPTPIPHLPMRLHLNLWASGSVQLAGRLRPQDLPARSTFRNLAITNRDEGWQGHERRLHHLASETLGMTREA